MRTHSPQRARAFTLVELLVVIGIIALLIAILMPSLSKARQIAVRIKCATNLKNMGNAMTMYTQQYSYYPAATGFNGASPYAIWPTRLRPFLNKEQMIFWCPAQETGFQWQKNVKGTAGAPQSGFGYEEGEVLLSVSSVPFSYGYNDWGTSEPVVQDPDLTFTSSQRGLGGDVGPGAGIPVRELRVSRVRNASDMIAIADNTSDARWDFNIDPKDIYEVPGKIHNKGCNVLFVDGHVQWYAQKEICFDRGVRGGVLTNSLAGARLARMWNNDNSATY